MFTISLSVCPCQALPDVCGYGQEPTQLEHLKKVPLLGKLLALPTNIRLGWKGYLVTNTLADYYNIKIVDINDLMHLKYKV